MCTRTDSKANRPRRSAREAIQILEKFWNYISAFNWIKLIIKEKRKNFDLDFFF